MSCLLTEQVQFDTVDQQQAIFGTQDENIRILEKALSVTMGLRDSEVEIRGEEEGNVKAAADILISMQKLYKRGETLNTDLVYRMLEEAENGDLEETFKAMDNVVTYNNKGLPIKCKTFGQKNYIKALQENVVTICIGPDDTPALCRKLAEKILGLRVFRDENDKMNRSLADVGGSVLVVSQFTLYGDVSHGRRPSFIGAAKPDLAIPLYEQFLAECERLGFPPQHGEFGRTHEDDSQILGVHFR